MYVIDICIFTLSRPHLNDLELIPFDDTILAETPRPPRDDTMHAK